LSLRIDAIVFSIFHAFSLCDERVMSATIKILSAGAVKAGLTKVVQEYQRHSDEDVSLSFATAPAILELENDTDNGDVKMARDQTTANPFLCFTDLPNAIRNITLLPAAWGEKNSVTSSS
jgi:ABC-type molybdate transport system substrate-binding protein